MSSSTNELTTALAALHERYPHWRFGQLVANVAAWAGDEQPAEIWDVTDEQLLQAALAQLARLDTAQVAPRAAS